MSTVAVGLRIVAAFRAGARPVARPRGVVHLYSGPLTRSGRFLPRAARPACGVRTRRLSLTEDRGVLDLRGRRFCRRCTSRLVPSLGRDVQQLVTRDDWASAYEHLTEADLIQAARWCRTVAETYQVSTVASMLLGGPAHTKALDVVLLRRRDRLRTAERTPEEIAAAEFKREAWDHDLAVRLAARTREIQVDRAQSRARRGGYLMPHERDLVKTA